MNEILFSTDETGLLCFIHPTIEAVLGIPSADLAGRVLFTFRPGTLPPTQRLNFLAQTEETVRQQGLKDDAVAASELRYRRLFESAKDGILILDAETGIIVDVNPFLTVLLNSTHDEIVGKQIWDLGFLKDIASSRENFLELQQQEYIRYDDIPLETTRGELKDVEFVSNVYSVNGKNIIQCNIRDISERKRTSKELHKYQENLEELVVHRTSELEKARSEAVTANLAKSRFVSNMSHEIRTPLNAILGFSQLMMREPQVSKEQLGHLETINRSGEHLLNLINEILDYSKMEAGRAILVPVVFHLPQLLLDLRLLFQERVDAKALTLTLTLEEGLPELVSTDEGKLRQILVNVIGNAVKFTAQGRIDIRVCREFQNGDSRLVVEVEDTGPGFSLDDLKKVFYPFEQGTQGVHAGGTGLGLALSRQYAQLLGGDISLVSELGRGSCFTVTVRIAEAESLTLAYTQPLARVRKLLTGSQEVRVLVVDDQEDNRVLLMELLNMVGFVVRLAVNGREAVEAFRSWQPQLILMDVKMPIMGGQEAIRLIRELPLGMRVKIIAVTASAFEEDREQAHNWGADSYLRKPFLENQLFDAIQALLGTQFEYGDLRPGSGSATTPLLTRESVRPFPDELVAKLKAAADGLDFDELQNLIGIVAKTSSVVANSLLTLLHLYQFEDLSELFRRD
jgi:PAS domain S-box-containing protein